MSDTEVEIIVPPSSQSHFAKFERFTPHDAAPFEDEFKRLAALQEWIPGSQQYTTERTIARRSEIKTHYFSSSQQPVVTAEDELEGYRALCGEVGLPRYDTNEQCKAELQKKLVNIIDLIDARRTMKEVKVWEDFEAFRTYTLQDGHRVNPKEARKDGGYLASLLRHLGRRRGRGSRAKEANGLKKRGTTSGGIKKRNRR